MQSVYDRNKMLLEKAQEESDGLNNGKSSLKATLTDQIKEQEVMCSSLKEVKLIQHYSIIFPIVVTFYEMSHSKKNYLLFG